MLLMNNKGRFEYSFNLDLIQDLDMTIETSETITTKGKTLEWLYNINYRNERIA